MSEVFLNTLQKTLLTVLKKEFEDGCNNRVVVGGIDNFNILNAPDLLYLKGMPPLSKGSYALLSVDKRKSWIKQVYKNLSYLSSREEGQASLTNIPSITPVTRVSTLSFVFKKTRDLLEKIGVVTVKDLLHYTPRDYNDYSKVSLIKDALVGQEVSIRGKVVYAQVTKIGAAGRSTKAIVADQSAKLEVIWFGRFDLAERLSGQEQLLLSGKISSSNSNRGQKRMHNPEYEISKSVQKRGVSTHAGGLIPVYRATSKLTQRMLRAAIRQLLDKLDLGSFEWLDTKTIATLNLPSTKQALLGIHFPKDALEANASKTRLIFDELLKFQLGIKLFLKRERERKKAFLIKPKIDDLKWYNSKLNFDLTNDQKKVLREVFLDMGKESPMFRLIQGEVGSGKTVVALGAMFGVGIQNKTAALLAPTEILAEQHFLSALKLFLPTKEKLANQTMFEFSYGEDDKKRLMVALLTGNQRTSSKKRVLELLELGKVDILIATQALFFETSKITDLGLLVVDEQHRFGVKQRSILTERTPSPHLLSMSATPIPRTLQMTVYGDMNISTLKEVPFKRSIKTKVCFTEERRKEAYKTCFDVVAKGKQVFVVCPFVEPSEEISARSALAEYERLKEGVFRDLKVGILHGKMKLKEKQETILKLHKKEIDVLVSTPVIEVGVDVPNATVMLVESAERFGLAQLHQIRGRVGRGGDTGVCFLLSDGVTKEQAARLITLERYDDGFSVADEDLKFRGPGDYIGVKQSGWDKSAIAAIYDKELLEKAKNLAEKIYLDDPTLKKNKRVLYEVNDFWSTKETYMQ